LACASSFVLLYWVAQSLGFDCMELILGIVWMVRKMLEIEELKYWNWVHFSFLLGSLKFEFLLHYLIAEEVWKN
jgi:hypothetical protein